MTKKTFSKKQTPTALKAQSKAQSQIQPDEDGRLMMDIYQTKKSIILIAPIAGVTEDDIAITTDNELLTITGKREQCIDIPEEDYLQRECYWGSFSTAIVLPPEAQSDKISASFNDGILRIEIPKNEQGTRVVRIKK